MPRTGLSRFFLLLSFVILLGCQPAIARDKAPDIILPVLGTGQDLQLSEIYNEAPVLLVFWASWCPGCMDEIPELNKLHEKFDKTGKLKILGVNVQETRAEVAQVQKDAGIQYPVLIDEEGSAASRFGIVGLPSSILIAKGGKILYYGFALPQHLEERIQQGELANEP